MGLTVHFKLAAHTGCDLAQAEQLVEAMRRTAGLFYIEGRLDRVHPIISDAKTLRRFGCDWLTLPVPGQANAFAGVEVFPTAGFLFCAEMGRDCEPLFLGLCQYPLTVDFQGNELRTKKGAGWQLAGFSKTQFASQHGWEHFQRCHCAVVELLAACQTPELRVKISDEGGYWPRRSLTRLRKNLDQMNGLVAAMAGGLKDAEETEAGGSRVQSPIFAHQHFERLEAEGAVRVKAALEPLNAEKAKDPKAIRLKATDERI